MSKLGDRVIAMLTPRVSPMVYLMMFISMLIGFCFYTGFLVQNGESILFANGAIIPVKTWGGLLFITATVAEVGFFWKKWRLVTVGAFAGFSLWLLASIDLFLGHHWYALLVLALFHMTFHMYVYLASSLGVLERESVRH